MALSESIRSAYNSAQVLNNYNDNMGDSLKNGNLNGINGDYLIVYDNSSKSLRTVENNTLKRKIKNIFYRIKGKYDFNVKNAVLKAYASILTVKDIDSKNFIGLYNKAGKSAESILKACRK